MKMLLFDINKPDNRVTADHITRLDLDISNVSVKKCSFTVTNVYPSGSVGAAWI